MQEPERPRVNISPLSAGIMAALVGLLGTWIGALIQGQSNLALEQKKFESALILKAIDTGDPDRAKVNLLFLIKAGFIQDPKGKIEELAKGPETVPVLGQVRTVPDVVGRTLKDAIAIFKAAGYGVGEMREVPSGQAAGTVIAQNPRAGMVVPQNTPISLVVAAH